MIDFSILKVHLNILAEDSVCIRVSNLVFDKHFDIIHKMVYLFLCFSESIS